MPHTCMHADRGGGTRLQHTCMPVTLCQGWQSGSNIHACMLIVRKNPQNNPRCLAGQSGYIRRHADAAALPCRGFRGQDS